MRTKSTGGAALLDDPADKPRTVRRSDDIRRAATDPLPTRRERPGASDPFADEDTAAYLRARSRTRIRRGLIPQSKNGRIAAGVGVAVFLGAVAAGTYAADRFLHRDPHFTIRSSSAIELRGNQHLSRAQLLSIFGEDVEENIFNVPLANRRDQLEQMPWVEHATVMRLLPNRLRVDVVERTPVAFVRQGGTIGMADANGVLLDIPPDAPGNPNYSFPVVTGLKADDSPESREQRMRLYTSLLKDLDSEGKKVSADLSEVDLSDPEDVKALLPTGNAETLVHFGTENFLSRYKRFQEHIGEWRAQYPRLSSVDMRYERQVVLQMPPKDSTVTPATGAEAKADNTAAADPATEPARPTAMAVPARTEPKQPARIAANTAAGVAGPSRAASAAPRPVPVILASAKQPPLPRAVPPTTLAAEINAPAPSAKLPAPPPAAAKKPTSKESAKQADMAKRVDAIKAWMAKRQQARDAAKARTAATP